MAFSIIVISDPNRSLVATIQKLESGVLGDYWDQENGVFDSTVDFNDRKIDLPEGTAENVGSYTTSMGPLDTYEGFVFIRAHDEGKNFTSVGGYVAFAFNGSDGVPAPSENTP